jgi:hypothetical protein
MKCPVSALVLCFAFLSAGVSFAANADSRVLTAPELAKVTSGALRLPPIQINVNTVSQIAVPVAIAVCAACDDPVVIASARAINLNLARLRNVAR